MKVKRRIHRITRRRLRQRRKLIKKWGGKGTGGWNGWGGTSGHCYKGQTGWVEGRRRGTSNSWSHYRNKPRNWLRRPIDGQYRRNSWGGRWSKLQRPKRRRGKRLWVWPLEQLKGSPLVEVTLEEMKDQEGEETLLIGLDLSLPEVLEADLTAAKAEEDLRQMITIFWPRY